MIPENDDSDRPTEAFQFPVAADQTSKHRPPSLAEVGQTLGATAAEPGRLSARTTNALYEPDTQIGPYKLVQLLGEGGMGAVYQAQQEQPVRRTVALKVIKPGMNSAAIVNRFQVELQALAMMDHPNIATVLDAGLTDTGLPYFVMEFVRGIPITTYCDQNRLTTEQRLKLFIPICQAIQHAHQKGIIHRDIKPTNVLVADTDQGPVPKVIDFGLARATEQENSEGLTQLGTVVGTLEYMSPEQAGLGSHGVDTRTDIYSLGVLLYELLTGTTPLEWNSLRQSGLVKILQAIQHEEAPRPSARFSGSKDSVDIAKARSCEPLRLERQLRGEIDWIILKALERDRDRRYESVNHFAQDVHRYLNHEAVEACPPSVGYRLRKFSRKHWKPLVAAGLLLLSMVTGLVFSTWQTIRATQAEHAAIEARDAATYEHAQRLIEERRHLLRSGLNRSLNTLVAIAAVMETWPELSRDEFQQFTQHCLSQNPEISSVTWVPRIAGDQRAAVEGAVQAEGLADFQFREMDADGGFSGQPARQLPEYFPVLYVEPFEPNQVILGMDGSNNPPRRKTLDQARDSGQMVASAPLLLGEEREGQLGFLVFYPVYRTETNNESERREALLGFAVAAFRITDSIDRILGDLADREVALTIYDLEDPTQPIYSSTNQPPSQPLFQQSHEVNVAGRRWRLDFATFLTRE